MLNFVPLESDLNAFILGLPAHPLVVHAAVVLLPLSALGLIVMVIAPSWRTRFGWATIASLGVGTGAVFLAKDSGEALAAKLGLPNGHALLGDILVPLSAGLFVVALAWLMLRNRAARTSSRSLAATVTGGLAVVLALATTGLTVLVGHSGSEAVWAGRVGETSDRSTPSASASATIGVTPAGVSAALTMAEVKTHGSASSCWSVVDGEVYDLTKWIVLHPGGASPILDMCGRDSSAAYHGWHGNSERAGKILDGYSVGKLG